MTCRVCPGDFLSAGKSKVKSLENVVSGLSCLGGLKVSVV